MLGLPTAADNMEGTAQCLTSLGVELDTEVIEARLPVNKMHSLQAPLADWISRSHACVKEVQSLIGQLSFACAVVRPGRYFLRGLIAQACGTGRGALFGDRWERVFPEFRRKTSPRAWRSPPRFDRPRC